MSEPSQATHQPALAPNDVLRPSGPANNHDYAPRHPLAGLQRAVGNAGVLQRLANPAVQPKLEIGAPDDKHEREADRVAAEVMRRPGDDDTPLSPAGAQISRSPDRVQRAPEDEQKHHDKPAAAPTKAAAPAAPGKGGPVPVPGKPAKSTPPTKKAPTRAPAKSKQPPASGPHARAVPGHAGGKPAAAPVAAKGPAKADPEHKKAHDVKAKEGHKHPDLEKARAKPHPKVAAHHKPDPKPKTGSKVKDHAGKDKPSPHHAGGPPKHIHKPANEAAQPPATPVPQAPIDERKPEEPHIAAKAASPGAVPAVTPAVAHTIQSAHGGGRPLSAADRGFFEPRLGRDLSGVRVHDDPAANQAARDVKAKAFAYGHDVFFAAGRHQPGTDAGRELIAHELAHTIQQRPGAKLDRKIQRQPAGAGGASDGKRDGQTITFDTLPVPPFRVPVYAAQKPLVRKAGYDRSVEAPEDQRDVWRKDVKGPLTGPVNAFITSHSAVDHNGRYFLEAPGKRTYGGTPAELATDLSIPTWDSGGKNRAFEVDHVKELQLGGTNTPSNMQLLDADVNHSSGGVIRASIERKVNDYITAHPDERGEIENVWREKFTLQFSDAVAGKGPGPLSDDKHWDPDAIKAGTHLNVTGDGGTALKEAKPEAAGSDGKVRLIPTGRGRMIELNPKAGAAPASFLRPYVCKQAEYFVGDGDLTNTTIAKFTFAWPEGTTLEGEQTEIEAQRLGTARFVGTFDRVQARLKMKGLSPINLNEVEIGPNGLYAEGKITTDLPIVSGASLDLTIDGPKVTLSHTFEAGEFKLPPPLKVTGSSLTVSASSHADVTIKGRIDAEIDRLGKGFLEAKGGTAESLTLDGGFDFTSDFFQKAHVDLHYKDSKFSGAGDLTIASGKVTGVKSGSLHASYAEDHFEASGSAKFDVPGIDSADVQMSYDAAAGLTLSASPKLKEMPGIKGGELTITIKEPAGGGPMKVSGHGTAQPDIPNVNAQLTVDYDDGAFLAKVDTSFKVSRIDGSITAGATNQPLDDKGLPVPGGLHSDTVVPFGSGSATVTLADGITGTAGIKLLTNGEVEVSGELTVQKNLWDGKDLIDKELLHASTSVPIFPPVVLHVGAGLHFKVGYGAGVLSGSVGITYNPDHEDQAKIEGKLHLHASAYASLELDTSIGLGLGGPGVSLTGNVVLGGELKINADLDNECDVTWSPSAGLKVTDTVKATLSPQFVIHLKASIELDLTVTDITLWSEDFGSFPFGSGLQAGLTWPVTYESGKAFEPSVDDIKVDKPDLNPGDLAQQILEEKGKK